MNPHSTHRASAPAGSRIRLLRGRPSSGAGARGTSYYYTVSEASAAALRQMSKYPAPKERDGRRIHVLLGFGCNTTYDGIVIPSP